MREILGISRSLGENIGLLTATTNACNILCFRFVDVFRLAFRFLLRPLIGQQYFARSFSFFSRSFAAYICSCTPRCISPSRRNRQVSRQAAGGGTGAVHIIRFSEGGGGRKLLSEVFDFPPGMYALCIFHRLLDTFGGINSLGGVGVVHVHVLLGGRFERTRRKLFKNESGLLRSPLDVPRIDGVRSIPSIVPSEALQPSLYRRRS